MLGQDLGNYMDLAGFWNYTLMATDWNDVDLGRWVYVGFNWFEALIWIGIAIYVLRRKMTRSQSNWGYLYSLSFLLFALSDLIESDSLTVGLLMFKLCNFGLILTCRNIVLRENINSKF